MTRKARLRYPVSRDTEYFVVGMPPYPQSLILPSLFLHYPFPPLPSPLSLLHPPPSPSSLPSSLPPPPPCLWTLWDHMCFTCIDLWAHRAHDMALYGAYEHYETYGPYGPYGPLGGWSMRPMGAGNLGSSYFMRPFHYIGNTCTDSSNATHSTAHTHAVERFCGRSRAANGCRRLRTTNSKSTMSHRQIYSAKPRRAVDALGSLRMRVVTRQWHCHRCHKIDRLRALLSSLPIFHPRNHFGTIA